MECYAANTETFVKALGCVFFFQDFTVFQLENVLHLISFCFQ